MFDGFISNLRQIAKTPTQASGNFQKRAAQATESGVSPYIGAALGMTMAKKVEQTTPKHYSDFSDEEKARYRASSPNMVETAVNLSQFPEVTLAPKLSPGEQMARMRAVPIEYDESIIDSNGKEKVVTKTGYVTVDEEDLAHNEYLQDLVRGKRGSNTGKIGVHALVLDDGIGDDGNHLYKSVSGEEAMNTIDGLRRKNLRVATQRAPYRESASDADKELYYNRSYPYVYESDDSSRYSYRYGNSNGNWRTIPGAVDEFINRYREAK